MLDALRYGLSHYFIFDGRTGRSAFWLYALGVFIIVFVSGFLDGLLFGTPAPEGVISAYAARPITTIVALAFLMPNISMAVRRLHDIGKSGWWILIGFIPIVGFFVLLYFYVQPSTEN